MANVICSIGGCSKKVMGRGWCSMHYNRWRRTGDPLGSGSRNLSAEERLWTKVNKNGPLGCWLWIGTIVPDGYGVFRLGGADKPYARAHRVVYELIVGPIPDGLHLDHLCRVRHCVNPEHLEPVTPKTNNLRGVGPAGISARRKHCPQGHPYSGENLYVTPRGERQCRICLAASKARFKERGHSSPLTMDGYLATKQAAEVFGLAPNTLLRYASEREDFPRPVRSGRGYMWEEIRLRAWRKAQCEARIGAPGRPPRSA